MSVVLLLHLLLPLQLRLLLQLLMWKKMTRKRWRKRKSLKMKMKIWVLVGYFFLLYTVPTQTIPFLHLCLSEREELHFKKFAVLLERQTGSNLGLDCWCVLPHLWVVLICYMVSVKMLVSWALSSDTWSSLLNCCCVDWFLLDSLVMYLKIGCAPYSTSVFKPRILTSKIHS